MEKNLEKLRKAVIVEIDYQKECDYLKSFSVWKRPPMQGPLWRREFFQGRAMLVFVVLLNMLIANVTLSIFIRVNAMGIIPTIMAIPCLIITHVSICNGFSSRGRNRIYFKETESISYWTDILFGGVGILFLAFCTWKV